MLFFILFILVFFAAIIGVSLLDNNSSAAMNEYCRVECHERRVRKYSMADK